MIRTSTAQHRLIGTSISKCYTQTCVFPDMRIAVVKVYGAWSREEARTHVRSAWYPCQYEVQDGDMSHGHTEPFYLRVTREEPLWIQNIASFSH